MTTMPPSPTPAAPGAPPIYTGPRRDRTRVSRFSPSPRHYCPRRPHPRRPGEGAVVRIHGESAPATVILPHPEQRHLLHVRWNTRIRQMSTINLTEVASVVHRHPKRPASPPPTTMPAPLPTTAPPSLPTTIPHPPPKPTPLPMPGLAPLLTTVLPPPPTTIPTPQPTATMTPPPPATMLTHGATIEW